MKAKGERFKEGGRMKRGTKEVKVLAGSPQGNQPTLK
jgi:hypothetical protein